MFFFLPLNINRNYATSPLITLTLILVNIIVFIGTFSNLEETALRFGFRLNSAAWYTWLTSLFLHGSLFHLIFNLYFLWIFGSFLEDAIGKWRYLYLYFFGGIISALTHSLVFGMVFSEWAKIPLIGASGAIAALMGLFVVRFFYHKIRVAYLVFLFFFIRWGVFELSSSVALLLWFSREVLYGYFQLRGENTGVANWAHIGGFVFGLIWAKFSRLEREARHEHHLGKARILKKKDWDVPALISYREALSLDPTNTEIMAEMAPLLADTGEKQKASFFYQIAIKKRLVKGGRNEALRLLMEAEEKLGEKKFDFTFSEKYALACAAESNNNLVLAEKLYRSLLGVAEVNIGEMAYFRLGEVLRKKGEVEAVEVFKFFVEKFPKSEWRNLAEKRIRELKRKN